MSENNETNNSSEQTSETSLITETNQQTENENNENSSTTENSEGNTSEKETTSEVEPLTADDITFPDDVQVNEELRDEFLSIVKAAQAASEASSNAWTEMQNQWREEVKADPEIGGDKLQPALGRIGRLITEYGSDKLPAVFDLTGAGNNPEVIKFLDKIAAKLVEGGPVSGQPTSTKTDAASRLFPSMKG
jgi:hypothetical protein